MVDNQGTPDDPSQEEGNGNNGEDTMTRREGGSVCVWGGDVPFPALLSVNARMLESHMEK